LFLGNFTNTRKLHGLLDADRPTDNPRQVSDLSFFFDPAFPQDLADG
jgi:hypothetical protein